MNYQKVYINQVSSTSTMDYLTQMWRNQLLCDAVIKTGDIVTKAHRVVLIAACPMLQNMENASLGSHLEVRMAADIKQDSVNAFLQYIYEGYMMLTEENCKDIEKMAKLLQVESLLNCCTDFYKNLSEKTGRQHGGPMINVKQGLNFQHLKFSNLQKTLSETALKRGGSSEEVMPGNKRQKFPSEAEKERVPSHDWNSVSQTDSSEQSNTVNLVEENLEVIHTDPAARDEEGWPRWASGPGVSHSHTISVSSQRSVQSNTQVVTIPDDDSGGSVNTNKSVHSAVTNLNHRSLTSQSNIHVPLFSTHNSSLFVPQSVSYMSTHVSVANRDSPTCSRDSLNRSDYIPMTLEHQHIPQSQSVQPSSQIPYAAGSERQQRSERQQIYVAPLSELPRSENFKVEEVVSDRTTVNDDRPTQNSEQKNSEYIDNSHIDSQKVSELLSGDAGQQSNISMKTIDLTNVKTEEDETGGLELSVDQCHTVDENIDDYDNDEEDDISYEQEDISGRTEEGSLPGHSVEGPHQQTGQDPQLTGSIGNKDGTAFTDTTCPRCQTNFETSVLLKEHFQSVHDVYAICKCGRAFKTPYSYSYHYKVKHREKKVFSCPICGVTSVYFSSMKRHLAKHSDASRWSCHICGKSYSRKDSLKSHMTSHSVDVQNVDQDIISQMTSQTSLSSTLSHCGGFMIVPQPSNSDNSENLESTP